MEHLLKKQAEIAGNIEKLVNNFKKESYERRYASAGKKIEDLTALFTDFHTNNLILNKYEEKTFDYFTGDHYESTNKYFSEAMTYIKKFIKTNTEEEQTYTEEEGGTSGGDYRTKIVKKLDEKLRKQAANYKAFQRTISSINIDAITEKWEFEDTLKTLTSRWTTVDSLHWEIESELSGKDNKELYDLFDRYENEYNSLKKTLNSKMWSAQHREKSTPVLEVPSFSGNYNQWISFKDLFSEAIHNNPTLSQAQKMQFLKSKVRGEAERLIQHLQISSDNYRVCWEILNNRYNNKKLIFSTHINILLELPIMKQQSLIHIKRMHDVAQESLNAIKNLGVDISTWDPLLVHILDQKLDADSHAEYIDSLKDRRELPVLKEFLDFLEGKFTAMESSRRKSDNNALHKQHAYNNQHSLTQPSTSSGKFSQFQSHNNWSRGNNKPIAKSTFHVTTIKCPLCNNDHGLYNCKKFLELSNEQKLKETKELRVCINCLFSHNGNECKSTKTCRKCTKKHNTILHDALNKSGITRTGATTTMLQNENMNSHVSQRDENDSDEILLSTAIIKVKGADGTYYNMRALIDQGSQVSLITERAAQQLKIKRQGCKGTIFGVGVRENSGKGVINIEFQSPRNDFKFQTNVIIMNTLVGNLPNKTFNKPKWTFTENILLADPEFYISRPVDILLSAEVYSQIILGGIIKGEDTTQPIAQQTKLGWLLCGSAKTYQCNVLLHNLDEIKRFWEVEEISEQSNMSLEDQECIKIYSTTTTRKEDGRYEVRLPLKEDIENKLGSSKQTALAQFRSLEKKFEKQPKLEQDYKTFMSEYKQMSHMKPASGNETPEYFLPHHGVERLDSLTSQYRVVYNASQKTNTGCNLNDFMYTGPNLQIDLQMLLLKWRLFQYAFTADIEKMFRMILVNAADQKYQKIFWRENRDEPIQIFKLTTVTYGTRAAPFLAMMTLRQLAADEREKYPEASQVTETAFYMDDLLYGADDIEEGKKLVTDLNSLMNSGGFNLRKWASNDQRLLEDIKSTNSKLEENVYNFKTENTTKTLGLCWNSSEDKFTFQCNIPRQTSPITKRGLLSEISRLFDPLGWLAPLSTKLKLLFQKLWKNDLKWDDQVSSDINKEWMKIKTELDVIKQYEVPRWLMCRKNDVIELHGFCDASIEAYGCVVYVKVKGQSKTTLLAAKTKLVPYKKAITLPRLELCGAHLLSKLMKKITEAFSQNSLEIYGWTDSMVVLGWLQGEPSRWKPFVANRVQKTTNVMNSACWRYVKSNENPADAASRGLYAQQLKEKSLWWLGPTWLSTAETKHEQPETYTTNLDTKKQCNVVQNQENKLIDNLLHKYSSINKVIRVVAWLLRALAPMRKQMPRYLTLQELSSAKLKIIKHVQESEFVTEIEQLRNFNKVEVKSKLLNLNPIIDNCGVLRVGGRLKNANINMDMKHPKIIPRDSRLAELLIKEAHDLVYHGGARLTMANLRQQYWIPGGNNEVKKQLRNCVTCRKNNPNKQHQLMGDLPSARVEPALPFYHTGVDYTGFVNIKPNKMRNARTIKGYVALFICMVTKAIHLELVTDLTSSAFLAALKRMSARRGAPRHLYSDCGTNFVGANRALQEEYEQLRESFDDHFLGVLARMNIEWHFNAPSWPSAGGLWERAVRSLKFHLRRVVGEQRLTFEEFSTILAQLEACLNSRPLCALTEDIEDLNFLTPAHFLTARAEVTIIETAEDARTRWYLTNQIFQQIWKRWKTEYLSQLNIRNKWSQPQKNIQIGDLVTIQDENLPPGKWPMARVTDLHPGRDGYVRVVSLKTENGCIRRPIVKLCVLPIKPAEPELNETRDGNDKSNTMKNITNNQKTRNRQPLQLYSIVMAVTFFMTLISNTHGMSNITQLNDNQMLYFDPIAKMQLIRDQWTLVAYYDMSPYWEGTTAFEKLLKYLEMSCSTMEEHNKCNMITPQLRHEYTELQYYNQLLLTQHFSEHSRQRRGLINGVGYIANSLFGVLDERFAEQYARDIELIKQNQRHLKNLWINQTSIVESEYNLIKRTQEIMNKQHKVINKHLNNLDKAINTLQQAVNEVNKEQDFTLTALTANSMLQNLKSIQNMMLNTISDVYQGQVNLHLLTPKQLQDQLNIISGLLNNDVSLPVENIHADLRKIYELMKIRARITEKYFIFEIKFPLISREAYDIYHIIAVPKQHRETMMITITPVSDYIAINLQKNSYTPITNEILHNCISKDRSTYMCNPNTPIYKMKSDKDLCILDKNNACKTNIAECKSRWISLSRTNTYLYLCCKQCQLRFICGDQITSYSLSRANIITLENDCVITTNEFTIHGHKQYQSQINVKYEIETAVVAPINHVINLTFDEGIENTNFNETEVERTQLLKQVETKLKHLKAEVIYEQEDKLSGHDIHQYVLIYIILAAMIVALVMWIFCKIRGRLCKVRGSWNTPPSMTASASPRKPRPAPRSNSSKKRCRDSGNQKVTDTYEMDNIEPIFTKLVFSDDSV